MSSAAPFALYNPALLSADALLGEFIARRGLLESLLDTIRQNIPGQSLQHVLLVGPRGMGKTTTLWAIAHSVNRDTSLAREWQPVVFDEESRRVGDLADFWLEAIRQWEHATKDLSDRTKALLDQASADIEDRARNAFLDMVHQTGRRALLLVDNLNDVLASISDPVALHRLRAFLMEEFSVMLIGGATRYFPQITEVDQPFYDFFRIFELKPLSLEEMKACLLSIAQIRGDAEVEKVVGEREGTMRSLHLLTGGNPRLIKTFYRLLAEGLRGDIRADLERLLDEFTPYFKSIVDALPAQQQRIFDAVALNWDPVDVATIARATRLASNQVSSQLRMLVKVGHIAEAAGSPKRKTYLLADRFSNIHYLMRHGRAARTRFDWFVAMLRLIFPDQSHAATLAKLARQTAESGPDGMRDARDLLHCALNRAETEDSRRQLLRATFRESWDSDTLLSLSAWIDLAEAKQHLPESDIFAFFQQMPTDLRRKLGFKPESAEWWYQLTDFIEEKSAWDLAEATYHKAIALDPGSSASWNALGNLLAGKLGKPAEAEAAYRRAIELSPDDSVPWNGLGNLLKNQFKQPAEAEAAYRKAIELDPSHPYPWNSLGNLLKSDRGRHQEAEGAYRRAIELDSKFPHPWNGLGNLLMENFGRVAEAESAYRRAIELDRNFSPAWNGLGNSLLENPQRPVEAETAYRRSIELDPKFSYPWNGLGNLLAKNPGRSAEAEAAYLKAIELEPASAFAWYGLGNLLSEHSERVAEAETAYRKAIASDPKSSYPWNALAILLGNDSKRTIEAEAAYRKAIELDPNDAASWNGLGNLLKNRLERPAEAEAAYRRAIELDPKYAYPWNNLGNLLKKDRGRAAETEAAYRRAIELDSNYGRPWFGLAGLLARFEDRLVEARACAVKGMALFPDYGLGQIIFTRLCGNYAKDWVAVLPGLAIWCARHSNSDKVFQFVLNGFIRLAQLTTPAESLSLLESKSEAAEPFETLKDAFLAHADRAHLDKLAPERRVVAIELLKRLSD